MTEVDNRIERRVLAIQLGLLTGLVLAVAGQEAADLTSSVGAQSSVLVVTVVSALLLEPRTRGAQRTG